MHIITLGDTKNEEIQILKRLLAWPGVQVHIRKPTFSEKEYARYIAAFSLEERKGLVAHQHHRLSLDYGLCQLHISETARDQLTPEVLRLYASTSAHNWAAFNQLPTTFKMAFVSPVFPSISKKGYGLAQQLPPLGRTNKLTSAIALGGINAERLKHMQANDFDDFALCGAIWEAHDAIHEAQRCYSTYMEWTSKPAHSFTS